LSRDFDIPINRLRYRQLKPNGIIPASSEAS